MSNSLDHILWGVPDFAAGVEQIGRLTGVQPACGGTHPGLGTQNALLDLGDGRYFEVIGPDPAQRDGGTLGKTFAALARPGIFGLAVRASGIEQIAATARQLGFKDAAPRPMSRTTPGGRVLHWRILMLASSQYGWSLPFFIDWGDADHPASSAPRGCLLRSLEIQHPNAQGLSGLLTAFDVDIGVLRAARPGFRAELQTPLGGLVLTA